MRYRCLVLRSRRHAGWSSRRSITRLCRDGQAAPADMQLPTLRSSSPNNLTLAFYRCAEHYRFTEEDMVSSSKSGGAIPSAPHCYNGFERCSRAIALRAGGWAW
jgi:hypothetical protein